jgi:hypothetical protein
MSRGLGRLERYLCMMVGAEKKPFTFAELRDIILETNRDAYDGAKIELRPSFERSLRRALHRLVSTEIFIALGSGGRADPHRYFINPRLIVARNGDDQSRFDALMSALEADRPR